MRAHARRLLEMVNRPLPAGLLADELGVDRDDLQHLLAMLVVQQRARTWRGGAVHWWAADQPAVAEENDTHPFVHSVVPAANGQILMRTECERNN